MQGDEEDLQKKKGNESVNGGLSSEIPAAGSESGKWEVGSGNVVGYVQVKVQLVNFHISHKCNSY